MQQSEIWLRIKMNQCYLIFFYQEKKGRLVSQFFKINLQMPNENQTKFKFVFKIIWFWVAQSQLVQLQKQKKSLLAIFLIFEILEKLNQRYLDCYIFLKMDYQKYLIFILEYFKVVFEIQKFLKFIENQKCLHTKLKEARKLFSTIKCQLNVYLVH